MPHELAPLFIVFASIATVVAASSESQELMHVLNSVAESIRSAGKQRNTIVHAQWEVSDQYPDALIPRPPFGSALVCKKRDFDQTIDGIIEARRRLRDSEKRVREFHAR